MPGTPWNYRLFREGTVSSSPEARNFDGIQKRGLCANLSADFRKGMSGEERGCRIILAYRARIAAVWLCVCFAVAVEMLQRGEQKLFYFVPAVEGYLADGRVVHDAEVFLYLFPAVLE